MNAHVASRVRGADPLLMHTSSPHNGSTVHMSSTVFPESSTSASTWWCPATLTVSCRIPTVCADKAPGITVGCVRKGKADTVGAAPGGFVLRDRCPQPSPETPMAPTRR